LTVFITLLIQANNQKLQGQDEKDSQKRAILKLKGRDGEVCAVFERGIEQHST
jgi:hypothetical protein